MSEPANSFRSLAGVPVLYDRINASDYGVRGVPHDFHVPESFQATLEAAFTDLWDICPLGRPVRILSAGTYSDRPPSQHANGRAMDIDAIIWESRRFVTFFYPTDRAFYLAVESVMRRHFDYVLTYEYNGDHHDHIHVDSSGRLGFGLTRTKMLYVQAYCKYVLGLQVGIDGTWGTNTEEGLGRAQEILGVGGDLGDLETWKRFLKAAAEYAFDLALHAAGDDPHFAEVTALNQVIEDAMADHPMRKFALEKVAELHRRLNVANLSPTAIAAMSPAPPKPAPGIILEIAATSKIARYEWNGRGRAPLGYTKGMALVFARTYCRLKAGDKFALEMAKAESGNMEKDALSNFHEIFAGHGMDNSRDGADTLRHLFTLMMGLGMRESSGKYCEGLYGPDGNTSGNTAEAGLFQTSYNVSSSSDLLPELFANYRANPVSAFLSVFKEEVEGHCKPGDAINYGSGDGRDYQRLAKTIPEFHAEFTAIAMRHVGGHKRAHWAPFRGSREAEVVPACDAMFKDVQNAVDEYGLCDSFI